MTDHRLGFNEYGILEWVAERPNITAGAPAWNGAAHTRVRDDAYGLNVDNGWVQAEDYAGPHHFEAGTANRFRMRFCVDEYNNKIAIVTPTLYVSRNSGAYTRVNASSSYVSATASSQYDDTTDVCSTQLLSDGTVGAFENDGASEETDGATPSHTLSIKGNWFETEFCVYLIDEVDSSDGDTFNFRLYDGTSPLDTYHFDPLVILDKADIVQGAGTVTGSGEASATADVTHNADGTATGSADATATATVTHNASGTATGSAEATATGMLKVAGSGTATGNGFASAVATVTHRALAIAAGLAFAVATPTVTHGAAATATGSAEATGTLSAAATTIYGSGTATGSADTTAVGFASATDWIVTVKDTDGDYTTVDAALDDYGGLANGLLSTLRRRLIVEWYDTTETAVIDTTAQTWATDDDCYVWIKGMVDHGGKYNSAAPIRDVASGDAGIDLDADNGLWHLRVSDIQFDMRDCALTDHAINHPFNSVSEDGWLWTERCISIGSSSQFGRFINNSAGGIDLYADSDIVYGLSEAYRWNATFNGWIYNCTIDDCANGLNPAGTLTRLKNCRITNVTTVANNEDINPDSDNNLSDHSTVPGNWGASSLDGGDTPTIDYVDDSNSDYTLRDYHINSTSDSGYDLGQDLSGDTDFPVTQDVDKETRSRWDTGADEYSAPSTVQGSATVTGSADASATASVTYRSPATVTGSAEATGTATVTHGGIATATGSAEATASADVTHSATATVTGSAEATGVSSATHAGEGTAGGSADVSATGTVLHSAVASVTGSAEATSTASVTHGAAGTATGSAEATGTADVTHEAVGTATGRAYASGTAVQETAHGEITGTGYATATATLYLATNSGTVTGRAYAEATGSTALKGVGTATGAADVSATGTVGHSAVGTATGTAFAGGDASVTHNPTASVTGRGYAEGTGDVTQGGAGTATGTAYATATATVVHNASGTATGQGFAEGTGTVAGQATEGIATGRAYVSGTGTVQYRGLGTATGKAYASATLTAGDFSASGTATGRAYAWAGELPGWGYIAYLDDGIWFRLAKYSPATGGLEVLDSVAYEHEPNVYYNIVLEADGNTLQAKVWSDAESEPAWMISLTDGEFASGSPGMAALSTTEVLFDVFSTGLGGDPYPLGRLPGTPVWLLPDTPVYITRSDAELTLEWTQPPMTGDVLGGVVAYELESQRDGDTAWTNFWRGYERTYDWDMANLPAGEYCVRVRAYVGCEYGPWAELCGISFEGRAPTFETPDGYYFGDDNVGQPDHGHWIRLFQASHMDDEFPVQTCLVSRELIPAGVGGECLFQKLYVTTTFTTQAQMVVTPILDGHVLTEEARTIQLTPGAGGRTVDRFEVDLSRNYESATAERFRYGMRGTYFQVKICVVDIGGTGRVEIDGVALKYTVARETHAWARPFYGELEVDVQLDQEGGYYFGTAVEDVPAALYQHEGEADFGLSLSPLIQPRQIAPFGTSEEAWFRSLYLCITRSNTTEYDIEVVPILDGTELEAETVTLTAVDQPVTEVYEIPLSRPYTRTEIEQSTYGLRGVWFTFRVNSASQRPPGEVCFDGAAIEAVPCRETEASS